MANVDLKQAEAQAAAEELATACRAQPVLRSPDVEHLLKAFQLNSGMKPSDYKVIGTECEVSSECSVQKAFAETMETFGRLDSIITHVRTSYHALSYH